MRKVREILRLRLGKGLSLRQVARCCQVSRSTVSTCEQLAQEAGLTWPIAEEVNLEKGLLGEKVASGNKPVPNWSEIHGEMKRKGVTLKLPWEEYKEAHGQECYQYTQFTVKYKEWLGSRNLSMPHAHKAGEKLFVDYAGQIVPVEDLAQGCFEAQIFVASLGASQSMWRPVEVKPSKTGSWPMSGRSSFWEVCRR